MSFPIGEILIPTSCFNLPNPSKYFTLSFIKYGLNVANKFSLRNMVRNSNSHSRSGIPGEWKIADAQCSAYYGSLFTERDGKRR